ncbi:Sua5/YciO/YrdC/YwlC family protein [Rubrobacter indicoceani]|nr:Sua5/YciO/YrdC/YwlC family protein [Rubrobacter indicoceani]
MVLTGEPGSGEASAVVDLTGDEPRILRASERLDEKRLREMLTE